MAITPVEYKKKRSGTTYNPDKKCYIGYRIDVWVNNVRYRNKRFPTRKAAENYIDSLKLKNSYSRNGLKFVEPKEVPRVSEIFRRRLEVIKKHSELVRAKRVFAYFQNLLDFDLRVTELRTPHFQSFINSRLEDGVKPETVNREVNVLSPPFKTASEVFPEILDGFEPPRIPRPRFKKSKGRTRVVTETEKNNICRELTLSKTANETEKKYQNRVRIGRMFEIAWLLGLRFGEVAKLKKMDFRPLDGTLKVIRWKTGAVTLFEYLPDFICSLLQTAADASETDFLYTISGNYPKKFYSILRDAVEKCGLVYGRKEFDGITFHSNRHSFTTRLIQTTDLATAQSLTGLSTKDLLGYYGHATDNSKKAAMKNLYGETPVFSVDELQKIYNGVQAGKLTFEEFCAQLAGVRIEVEGTNRTQKLRLVKQA